MFINFIIILLSSLTIINSFPCPSECICKPTDMDDVDFTRMSYLINCSNIFLNNQQLIYEAEEWSINEDKTTDYDDDDPKDDYIISIDLSNSLSLKMFTNKTIQLRKFSYSIQSLSLSNQEKNFTLNSNSFYSSIYENLKILNLSSCCKQIPNECQEIFRPLKYLQVLDLSESDMYKTCLSTPDTISSKLRDLILRNNIYDKNTFSNSSRLFDGVRTIRGTLDLQNSRFQLNTELNGNCLFDLFQQITTLDLSSIQFESISNNITIGLTHLLECKTQSTDNLRGTQLINLYLRQLKLEYLPEWFTHDRFPILNHLDLSNNNFYHIALNNFINLRYISLAYNPIELNKIKWRPDTIYKSINLRSTIRDQTFNLSRRLTNLFKLTKNIDYSENEGKYPMNITNITLENDFDGMEFSLNISRTNLYLFQIDLYDIRRLDISFNHLKELNLGKQMKLNYIDCSNQYLKKLILNENLLELNELKCSNNSLKTIENFSLLKNEQLKLIDLSNNLIDSLENLFRNLTGRYLRTINLKLNSIEIIPSYIFHRKLISLYDINLSWNKIHTIQKYAFQSPNLQILDLTGNPLKIIESNAILTVPLRLFYIFNDTQQLTDRCIQANSNDNLLYMYINWFAQNGTLMPKHNQVNLDKCSIQYIDSIKTKSKSLIKQTKNFLTHYILYEIIGIILIGILFGGIYYYRKNPSALFARLQHYKKLDRDRPIQNPGGISEQQREEDEIIMNLEEPPFRTSNRGPTNV
ncbi:unnamed protein product [Rotaria sordida]|uniref:Uncharacterized protein n=1 Tax=Rotaria sordida TaxID=392033 RepID=A0A813YJ52_9BILA|nr:unnamed protein product [Rotaria sordida]